MVGRDRAGARALSRRPWRASVESALRKRPGFRLLFQRHRCAACGAVGFLSDLHPLPHRCRCRRHGFADPARAGKTAGKV